MTRQMQYYQNKLAYETDSSDLKAALEAGENIIVVDARSAAAYEAEHIPGAINLPHRMMSSKSTQGLIVTYCDGIGCNASTKSALSMA